MTWLGYFVVMFGVGIGQWDYAAIGLAIMLLDIAIALKSEDRT